ncbi:MAG: sulfatase-like hydrolase/transferase [Myxococcota bacterium]
MQRVPRAPAPAVFKLALLALSVYLSRPGFLERLQTLGGREALPELLAFLAIWVLGLVALVVVAFLPRLWMRAVWAVPMALSTLLGSAVHRLTGAQLGFVELLLYWSERAHALSLLEVYWRWLLLPAAAVGLGILALLLPPGRARLSRGALLAVPLAPWVVILALLELAGGRGTAGLPEQFRGFAMATRLVSENLSGPVTVRRMPVTIPLARKPLAERIVLVVDEAIRGDFIDLNRRRGTTPELLARAGAIANFGYAISGANCSLVSHLILRYGGLREAPARHLRSGASIWDYAHAAGYRTVYIDGQQVSGRLQNGMTLVERSRIDEFIQLDGVDQVQRDPAIALRLRELLQRPGPLFVYVVKSGAHFAYERRYPPEASHFEPHLRPGEPVGDSRARLVNSYQNAVRWSVDGFFSRLLDGLDLNGTLLLYTADHGQNLMDAPGVLHCNPTDPHPLEGVVPLLALGDEALLARWFRSVVGVNRDRATHFEIFPTLLTLFGFDRARVDAEYGESLLGSLPQRAPGFVFGPLLRPGGGALRRREVPPELLRALSAGAPDPREPAPGKAPRSG